MNGPHVLRYDPTRRGRVDTFSARAETPHLWRFEVFARFGTSKPFHAIVFAHEPLPGGGRRKDPEGAPAMLLARVSEDVWRIESCRITRSAPMASFDLHGWQPPSDAA